jgi:hypothetical protein
MGVWVQGCILYTAARPLRVRVRGRVRALPTHRWGASNGWPTGDWQLYSSSYATPYEAIDEDVDSGLYPVYCGASS